MSGSAAFKATWQTDSHGSLYTLNRGYLFYYSIFTFPSTLIMITGKKIEKFQKIY